MEGNARSLPMSFVSYALFRASFAAETVQILEQMGRRRFWAYKKTAEAGWQTAVAKR